MTAKTCESPPIECKLDTTTQRVGSYNVMDCTGKITNQNKSHYNQPSSCYSQPLGCYSQPSGNHQAVAANSTNTGSATLFPARKLNSELRRQLRDMYNRIYTTANNEMTEYRPTPPQLVTKVVDQPFDSTISDSMSNAVGSSKASARSALVEVPLDP